jgi:hypothetical protein
LEQCDCAVNVTLSTCRRNEVGFDYGLIRKSILLSGSGLSLLATGCVLIRFAFIGRRNQFNVLVATLNTLDLMFALKNILSETVSLSKIGLPGTTGCVVWAWVDKTSLLVAQSWNFILMLNLFLMARQPNLYKKWAGKKLTIVFVILALIPPLVECLGATLGDMIIPIPDHPCGVGGVWKDLDVYFLLVYYTWCAFTLLLVANRLRMGLLEICSKENTRSMLHMVAYTLAFVFTWVWFIANAFLSESTSNRVKFTILLADKFSYSLLGFTNGCLWFFFTRARKLPLSSQPLFTEKASTAEVVLTMGANTLPSSSHSYFST